jgi:dTDP-4-amino-4,6-dideoxygalactose transaminase
MGAMLGTQLDKMERIQSRRAAIHARYDAGFSDLAAAGQLTLPTIPDHIRSNHHLYYVLMKDEQTRNDALTYFKDRGVGTTFHYLPLHLAPVGRDLLGCRPGEFPVTESVSTRLLRLPIYPDLTEEEQQYVIETMHTFFAR